MDTAKIATTEATAMHSWTTAWAASTQDGGTGVVDRRRRTPSSR